MITFHFTKPANPGKNGVSAPEASHGGTSGGTSPENLPTIGDVLAAVQACPALPEAVKAAILAMVREKG